MSACVLVTDYTFADFSRYASELKVTGARLVVPEDNKPENFLRHAGKADALLHEHLFLTSEIIAKLDRCKVIAHHGKGVDNIDVAAATQRGILVANVLDASMHEVSEHVFALMLSLVRGIKRAESAVRQGRWHVSDSGALHRLNGRTFGLVGFGNIARHVACKARAFGMNVNVYSRSPSDELARQFGVNFMALDDVFRTSDVLSLHLPLTDQTQEIASRARLRLMKPEAILINVSRGGLIDEGALVELLHEGRLAGAGLDVLNDEPPLHDNPLLAMDNVVLTPHSAWYSLEGVDEVERRTAREAARVLLGEWPVSLVNPEAKGAFEARWGKMRSPAVNPGHSGENA